RNVLGLHRESWLRGLFRSSRRRPLHGIDGDGDGRPQIRPGATVDAAPVGNLPLREVFTDHAERWRLRSVVHHLRYKTIVSKLRRLDVKLIRALARLTHAIEREALRAADVTRTRTAREALADSAQGRSEDELEHHHRFRELAITIGLI